MSLYTNVKIMLDTKLSTVALSVPIIYDNVTFKPTKNQPYIASTVIHAPSSDITLYGDQVNVGVYQISAFYPSDKGSRDLFDALSTLYDHFKSELNLNYLGETLYIRQVSLSPITNEGIWFTGNISVTFNYYSN